MTSAWGNSFGSAWGNAWGAISSIGIKMPSVIGVTIYEAMQILQKAGIYIPLSVCGQWPSMLTIKYGQSYLRPGFVSGQSITAGTYVLPNIPIDLTVSQFPFGSSTDSIDWSQR